MKRRKLLIALLVLSLGTAVYSGSQVVSQMAQYKQGEAVYDEMMRYCAKETVGSLTHISQEPFPATEGGEGEEDEEEFVVDFEALTAHYGDVVGWLCIEGTDVSYPVVQAGDNEYYLKRLPDGTWNNSGSIFMDCRNASDFSDQHTIIYGHNMRNNTMFAGLMNYKEQSYYDEHPQVLILTPEGRHYVTLFAGYVTSPDSDAWELNFADGEAFSQWCEDAKERSCFVSDVLPECHDSIVTLSTCSYEYDEARFVLVGVLQ